MSDIETLHEAVIDNIKDTLKDSGKFAAVNEGEVLEDYYKPVDIAQVIEGETTLTVKSATSMQHDMQVWVLFLTTDEEKSLKDMRKLGYEMYTLLYQDYTRGGTCWRFFPKKFEPGYVAYNNQLVVGVQTRWQATLYQDIPTPS